MSPNGAVGVALRVLHIAATCTSLGGLFYARMVLWPNLERLPESEREPFLRAMIRRYAHIKWTGVTVVAITGIVNWTLTWPLVTNRSLYVTYFVVKMIGAVGLFGITFLLALPSQSLRGMQRHRAFWSGLNIACGLTILVGAAMMRSVVKVIPEASAAETTTPPAETTTPSTPNAPPSTPTTTATTTSPPALDTTAGAVADPFTHDATVLVVGNDDLDAGAPAAMDGSLGAQPTLEVQSVTVTGSALPREAVMTVVQAAQPRIAICYAVAAKGEPELVVTVGVDFDVGVSGGVTSASVGSGTILPAGSGFGSCVIGVFRSLAFPSPAAPTHVSCVLQLTPPK